MRRQFSPAVSIASSAVSRWPKTDQTTLSPATDRRSRGKEGRGSDGENGTGPGIFAMPSPVVNQRSTRPRKSRAFAIKPRALVIKSRALVIKSRARRAAAADRGSRPGRPRATERCPRWQGRFRGPRRWCKGVGEEHVLGGHVISERRVRRRETRGRSDRQLSRVSPGRRAAEKHSRDEKRREK